MAGFTLNSGTQGVAGCPGLLQALLPDQAACLTGLPPSPLPPLGLRLVWGRSQ